MSDEPIACSLGDAAAVAQRLDEWQALLATSRERHAIEGGVRVTFAGGSDVAAEVAALAAAEVECCRWIDFSLLIDADQTTLEARATAEEGQALLVSLFCD